MAKVEKINQTKDNIAITGDSVTFSDLTITNKDLADYLAESDNMLESLESIIEIGVKTMNSLKNSIERDFTKQTFETIAEEMKKNLSDSVDDMGDEFNKYFNEDGEFVKELNENKKKMLEELNNELENFVDPSNRESAISKLTEILETEEGKMVDAFEKALNPENSESQIFQLKEKLEKKFTDEIKLLSEDMEKILQELKIDKATTELKEKSTAKGGTHEDFVQKSLSKIAV